MLRPSALGFKGRVSNSKPAVGAALPACCHSLAVPSRGLAQRTQRKAVCARGSPYSTPLTNGSEGPTYPAPEGHDTSVAAGSGASHPEPLSKVKGSKRAPATLAVPHAPAKPSSASSLRAHDLAAAESALLTLIATPDLDACVEPRSPLRDASIVALADMVDMATAAALVTAYGPAFAAPGLGHLPSVVRGEGGPLAAAAAATAALRVGGHRLESLDLSSLDLDSESGNESPSSSLSLDLEPLPLPLPSASAGTNVDRSGLPAADPAATATPDPANVIARLYDGLTASDAAHLYLHRTLYRINRLNLFWFDALDNYDNDRSHHLGRLRDAIEAAWTAWEGDQFGGDNIKGIKSMSPSQIKEALQARYKADVTPPLSPVGRYITEDMGTEGYRQLLAIASLDGLVEASRQSRVCGGAANEVQCMIFKVLSEEYGGGRLPKKHSTFFAAMMRELGLNDTPEAYLDEVPWQVLAGANHNFLLTERRRHYLRYVGGLSFFEIVGPSVYTTYMEAAKRLGLSDDASGYWGLHIKEDERHGRWMLEAVCLPLVDMYPGESWELLLGYDQEKFMAQRAAFEVLARIREADEKGFKAALAGVPAGSQPAVGAAYA